MSHDIDFVLTYLDGNDLEWQKERNKYTPGKQADLNPNRYRNWDNLPYFFRAIEKYAPWVRKVHVVTCGHVPAWLNLDHPKINIVRHSDYIPAEWLPTFSSRCIDMNLHRIKDLAEHFVYFNDDMFLTAPVKPDDFFVNGLPCDSAILSPQYFKLSYGTNSMHVAPMVGAAVINKHFNKKEVMAHNWTKWINPKYGREMIRTLQMMPFPHFVGFLMLHLPYSYQKSTYEEVWQVEPEMLATTSSHKFREPIDLNHWIFSYWQMVTGQFAPRRVSFGKCYQLHTLDDAKAAAAAIRNRKYRVVCLNDAVQDGDFDAIVATVNSALEENCGGKSSFEI